MRAMVHMNVDPETYRKVRDQAAREDRTLTAIIRRAVEAYCATVDSEGE